MNIAGIDYESINDGERVRTVIYVSGCSHNCFNCHNPNTHDINYGVPFTEELQNEIIDNIQKRPFISGITWSGGDPLHENNLDDVLDFTNKIRLLFPQKTIWIYSGFTWQEVFSLNFENTTQEELESLAKFDCRFKNLWWSRLQDYKRQKIISQCTVMVDGRYIDSQRDITLPYCGSKNQRVIDTQKSLKEGEIILWTT